MQKLLRKENVLKVTQAVMRLLLEKEERIKFRSRFNKLKVALT